MRWAADTCSTKKNCNKIKMGRVVLVKRLDKVLLLLKMCEAHKQEMKTVKLSVNWVVKTCFWMLLPFFFLPLTSAEQISRQFSELAGESLLLFYCCVRIWKYKFIALIMLWCLRDWLQPKETFNKVFLIALQHICHL